MSQKVFAENIGITQPQLGRLESGQHVPSTDVLLQLQRVFGTTPEEILYGPSHEAVDRIDRIASTLREAGVDDAIAPVVERVWRELEAGEIDAARLEAFLDDEHRRRFGAVDDELAKRREQPRKPFGDLPADDARPEQLPLYRIAAGAGVEPLELYTYVDNPAPQRFSPRRYFVLRIEGESMSGDDLHHGDLVIVRRSEVLPLPHQIAVLENTVLQLATLKRVRQEGAELELIPSNPEQQPFRWEARYTRVKGIFVQRLSGV
jgi:SOS-response transcriptional repressor LexA